MKIKLLLSVLVFGHLVSAYAQGSSVQLNFSAVHNGQLVPLDSIFVENLVQGGDTTLYLPDSVLVLDYSTGISRGDVPVESGFLLAQNYPNPFQDKTTIYLNLPEDDHIEICIRDMNGAVLARHENALNQGIHSFAIYSGNAQYYLLSATGMHERKTIKMQAINDNSLTDSKCRILYNGVERNVYDFKKIEACHDFAFTFGDVLRFTGFAKTMDGAIGSGVFEDAPQGNESYFFELTKGLPCPGIPYLMWMGQAYHTVLIGNQCWLKENLNYEFGNSWCYDNDTVNCAMYGRLYDWETALVACPDGWHLPSDAEWNILEGSVDSQYPVGDPVWESTGWRGLDVGFVLKSTSAWDDDGNGNDFYGFGALPGGKCSPDGVFSRLGANGYWWSSTESTGSFAWRRGLSYEYNGSFRYDNSMTFGRSIRCLRD